MNEDSPFKCLCELFYSNKFDEIELDALKLMLPKPFGQMIISLMNKNYPVEKTIAFLDKVSLFSSITDLINE